MVVLSVGCASEPMSPAPDAGSDDCAAVFGVCHADLDGACFLARSKATGEVTTSACAASFTACEDLRAAAIRAAGCGPN